MTTLNIRNVPDDIAQRFQRAAAARQMTYAEYLGALVELHDYSRLNASGTGDIRATLEGLNLATVTA